MVLIGTYGRSQHSAGPIKTEELKHFYPTSTMVTGYDIIFFWVIRMVFSGIEQVGEVPVQGRSYPWSYP